jgi:cupin 2 domain-containing protein
VPTLQNVYADVPQRSAEEQIVELLSRPGLRIERIVSTGHASPAGFWYDEPEGEWVIVLSGTASLRFEDEAAPRLLEPGHFVEIAPHRRHRVDSTDSQVPTIWLAVHYAGGSHPLTPSVQPE